MKEVRQCINRKSLIIITIIISIAVITGISLGAKYLNKSQQAFKVLETKLKESDKIVKEQNQKEQMLKNEINEKDELIDKLKSWKDKKSFVMINRVTLENNLKYYTKLSPKNKKIILDTVISEAKKYNINPLILYSLLDVESSMRFWIEHPKILVTFNDGKKRYIRAVGLGGVVWEWWGDALKKNKIAEVRSDLFGPETNIKAVAFILNEFSKRKMLKGCKSKDESMLRRYFGGNFKSYSDKIDKKVISLVRPNLYRY